MELNLELDRQGKECTRPAPDTLGWMCKRWVSFSVNFSLLQHRELQIGIVSQRFDVFLQVIPALSGDATDQTPPDLPSYLFKERIVYLGMSLVPAVTELMLAELLYLQYDNPNKPIYMYINSTGVAVRFKCRFLFLGQQD